MMEYPFVCNVWSYGNDPFFEHFKDVFIKKIQKSVTDMLKTMLKTIPVEDLQRCYQKWEQRLHRFVAAQWYFEGDNIDV